MDSQRIASIVRQIGALAAILAGALTGTGTTAVPHGVNPLVSGALVIIGGLIFHAEHVTAPQPTPSPARPARTVVVQQAPPAA